MSDPNTSWSFSGIAAPDFKGSGKRILLKAAIGAIRAADRMRDRGVSALRADTRRGFPNGRKLANTWRGIRYPDKPGVFSLSPTVQFFSKAPKLARAFEEPATIRPKNGGKYICIPTENAPKPIRTGRGKNSKRDWVEAARRQHPDMEFFPIQKGQFGLLGVKRPGRKGAKGLHVLFVCVRQATLRKRMNFPRVRASLELDWPRMFRREVLRATDEESCD